MQLGSNLVSKEFNYAKKKKKELKDQIKDFKNLYYCNSR
jgi:hypothetical protein